MEPLQAIDFQSHVMRNLADIRNFYLIFFITRKSLVGSLTFRITNNCIGLFIRYIVSQRFTETMKQQKSNMFCLTVLII